MIVSGRTLGVFSAAALLLAVVPGPAVFYIVARSIHQGRRAGALSALGVAAGGLVHVLGAVVGLSAILVSSALAFSVVRWAGAAYLVWLGVRTLRARDGEDVAAPAPAPPRRLFVQGFVVNLLNPKTAIFFLAFLPQFVDPARGSAPLQFLVLGLTFIVVASSSDLTYALLAGTVARRVRQTPGSRRTTRLVTGSAYLALGAGAALAGGSHE